MLHGKYAVDYEERINFNRLRSERLQRAKDQINKEGYGALLTWDATNVRYITGYNITTPTRPAEITSVLLPRNGDPILYGVPTPSDTAEKMPWLKGLVRPGLGSAKLNNVRNGEGAMFIASEIAKVLAEHGVEKEPLALDGTVAALVYQEAFAKLGIKTVYAKPAMAEARAIKTKDEIALMEIACSTTDAAFAAIADAIRPGIRECDLIGVGMKALYEQGVDHVENFVSMAGDHTNPFGYSFTDRTIQAGDLVYVDVNACSYMGYMPCVYRTFCCGKANAEQKEVYEASRAMLYEGMSVIKHGASTRDVLDKFPQSPKYWGFDTWFEVFPYAFAHGIGLTLHEPPTANLIDHSTGREPEYFQEGQIVAVETWVGKRGSRNGVRLEEDIVVTKDGYRLITRFPIDELMECWR